MSSPVLIFPGYANSGPDHWQSLWQSAYPQCQRITIQDWMRPQREVWVAALEREVARLGPDVLIAAHSMGSLTVAHWAAQTSLRIRGALLVAVPDPQGAAFPATASGYEDLPSLTLPFPAHIIASQDDPYASMTFSQQCAQRWGCALTDLGQAGHINAESGLADWPQGWQTLQTLSQP
ncbi:alpha/beta hydrolase [Undibacterium sp. CY7W]|uniref:Alpha/beta hydrolase n=1 Tax=Undibacterium rugosum TaxID=2762291 RepID=A0A923HYQ5_9BURK|nr:alpha/beta hydrolase [Undibacterium rugosum]MBC3933767.1 alpha/beta hydrolase [Undibacterium rugosum]